MEIKAIAYIRTDFPTKFGIPRQGMELAGLTGRIVFEPEFRNPDSLRGIEGFSHLWLVWEFSEHIRQENRCEDNTGEKTKSRCSAWSPTVRPPRLGGNVRMGVFATRSPFRPNPIGLTCVRLLSVEKSEQEGCVLVVSGADLMDGTPIYDIKPYLPLFDSKPEASGGFTQATAEHRLQVNVQPELLEGLPQEKRQVLLDILSQDPRPGYQEDCDRVYGFGYAGHEVRFRVNGDTLTVVEVR